MIEFKMDKTFHLTQNFEEDTKLVIDLNSKLLCKLRFKVHHESITLAKVVSMPNKILVTCASSYTIRLWSLFGKNLCILNLEYPLPHKWEISIDRFYQRKLKYIAAMKIKKKINSKLNAGRNNTLIEKSKSMSTLKTSLEKCHSVKTFKHLVSEIKNDTS